MTTIDDGEARIAWAGASMPVLAKVGRRLAEAGTLRGLRVGVNLVLEPKTANLAQTLADAGAEVVVACGPSSTDDAVAEALRRRGFAVHASSDADEAHELAQRHALLESRLDILVDDGAEVTRLLHKEHPELLAHMLGATEETTSGVRPLRVMHDEGALRLPVIAVNDARTKYLFDNLFGTGQSCVMALLDLTNLQLSGRHVAVVGYGWVGMGVARHAAALGARVTVSEVDPVKALRALHDGHRVAALGDVADEIEVVFACTGLEGAVTESHVEGLRDGVILATAGGGPFELPMPWLDTMPHDQVRHGIRAHALPSGKTVLVASRGECINCADAEGNPIEVMDLSLSLQALAVERVATHGATLGIGVHDLPAELDDAVARIRLSHAGASVEPMSDRIRAAMRQW